MTNYDSLKAWGAAVMEAMKGHRPLKVGEPCPNCGRPLEAIERGSDQPVLVTCPYCDHHAEEGQ